MAAQEREQTDPETIELLNTILDTIRQEHGLTSDEALRQHLKVSDLTIYRWRRGEMGKSARVLIPLIVKHVEQTLTAA
jgi:ribosome-binding protein aMBF1 (putative translation factor)